MIRNVFVIVLLSAFSSVAHADAVHNVATALDYAGFDARGSRNPVSGGIDLLINRQFNGNVFDFGNAELAVQGPVSLQLSTGGRIIPSFEASFSTALNDRSQATPLNYNYSSDIGLQSTTLSGSTLVDATFSINALGFYNLDITSSNRNTVTREGAVSDTTTIDSDIGPLSISGNIFVDALAAVTDPLFEQAGKPNPFDALSKRIGDLPNHGRGSLITSTLPMPSSRSAHAIVPEPTVLAMLLVGWPALAWFSRRSR